MKKLQLTPLTLATALCLALGGLGLFLGFGPASHAQDANAPQSGAAPKPSMTVTTAKPSQASLPLALAANGNIAAWQEASVASESGGLKLQEVRANVGDAVKAGQVLAVFASDTVQADVALAKANLAEAQAQAADAAANAERARSLQASGALSAQQINQYSTTDLSAKARVQSAEAALLQQNLRLKHALVLAPDSGIISARGATVGAVPGAGTELFRLIRQGRLEWRAEVTATELGRVKVGTPVQVVSASGSKVAGRVRMVAPTVDVQSRAALVYVDLKTTSADSGVKAGMFARGEFALGNSNALTVPQEAVVVRDGFSYVFAIGAANKVAQHKVEVGRRVGTQVEILKGLAADATVAVTGAGFLNDGDTVRLGSAK
ncbi:efflux transporter periplasmic adaptor subunit [Rhodoferax lacus]|uniref:Efflux transporter periplasmic adaptor subunit n=1 Tax=Rhodoferax lacus TaxID=2184758 RepID=A0A3E1RIW5_9BURK|nr:efflux RND transporter periplasmic adaptor subunit [Rhodoferax lacus]RFO98942.1 efflux transporter periplasmic adaptor subunit [Rhodoferax lacus]